MQIGELSRRTGASPRSLRFYEQHGLIDSGRRENGYREFDESAVRVVRNIRTLLGAGLTMADVAQIGECLFTEDLTDAEVCDHVLALYESRIATVDAHLAATRETRARLDAELKDLRERAGGRGRAPRGSGV